MQGHEERVLIVSPTRRDGEVTLSLLAKVGLQGVNCASVAELAEAFAEGAGVIMLTEAAIPDPGMPGLLRQLASQPTWSDIPIVMLARDRDPHPAVAATLNALTNVTLLDRPASTRSMLSAVQAALNARRRQYQIREHIDMLARAESALRETDRRKDEFLATLAHELRNPLAPLRTGITVLKMLGGQQDAQAARMLAMMERQLEMLIKLIDELLDVARISSGKIELSLARVDLREVIDVALEGSDAGGQSRRQLSVDRPSDPVWVMGDKSRLAQVVSNLLNNAMKYTPEEGRIHVSLAADHGCAVIRVADSGVGIPVDMLGRVFDMFAQIEGTRHRSQGGLGLGLSLVRSLVELHGGKVMADSAGPGKGSTFTLRLPLATPVAQAQVPSPVALSGMAQARRALRVLIVDDNIDAAEALAMSLRSRGHTIRCEHSGSASLSAAAAFMPDVVFCDIGMPGLNGYEVAARMRGDMALKHTRLVALTGWGSEQDKRRAAEAGFDHHLTKPASASDIDAILSTN